MDATRVALLREVLATTGWVERAGSFARELCEATRDPGGLLLVGTPEDEPWHLAAHLDDESRWHDLPNLTPTLVRWSPPPVAPAHLRIGMDRIEALGRGETLFVVAPQDPPARLLERASDARKSGAAVFSLDSGRGELGGIAHEALSVPPTGQTVSFDAVQHLITSAAGEGRPRHMKSGLRARLGRLLDAVSGPAGPH